MRPVSSHFLNLSIVDPQGFGVERAEQERVGRERERMERERAEQERAEQERAERRRAEQERAEQERAERKRAERERVERERIEQERIEQELLFRRLEPVKAGYHRKLCCMDGTRQSLLNQIMDWVANISGQANVLQRNAYWFYGSPGIGKTSLAHSICASLHERNHLAGAFFCRRDDPNLSEPINILPTFIYKLAILFPPFRTIVAKHLRDNMFCRGILWFLRCLLASPLGCTFQLGASLPPGLGRLPDQMSTSRCPQTIFSVETLPSRHYSHPRLPAIANN